MHAVRGPPWPRRPFRTERLSRPSYRCARRSSSFVRSSFDGPSSRCTSRSSHCSLIYDDAVEDLSFVARAFGLDGIGRFAWIIIGHACQGPLFSLSTRRPNRTARYTTRPIVSSREAQEHFAGQTFANRPATVMAVHAIAFVVIMLAFVPAEFAQTRTLRKQRAAGEV